MVLIEASEHCFVLCRSIIQEKNMEDGRIRTNDSSGCDSTRLCNFKTFSAFYNIHGSTAKKKKIII
jgi:hypothetical protein